MSDVTNDTDLIQDKDAGAIGDEGSLLTLIWRTFRENKLAVASLFVLGFMILFSFVGPFIYRTNQSDPFAISSTLINGGSPYNLSLIHI